MKNYNVKKKFNAASVYYLSTFVLSNVLQAMSSVARCTQCVKSACNFVGDFAYGLQIKIGSLQASLNNFPSSRSC
jgi:hypothetical protein